MTSVKRWKTVLVTLLVVVGIRIVFLIADVSNKNIPAPHPASAAIILPGIPAYNLECKSGLIILPESVRKAVFVMPPCSQANDGYSQWIELINPDRHFEMLLHAEDERCQAMGAGCYLTQTMNSDDDKPAQSAGGSLSSGMINGGAKIPKRLRFKNLQTQPIVINLEFP